MSRFMLVAALLLVADVSLAQTGSGSAGGSATSGGALGTSATKPGPNSAGTALPSGRKSGRRDGGSLATGTGDPRTDKEDKAVDRKIKSICKGC